MSGAPRAASLARAVVPCDNGALRVARRLKTGRVPVSVATGDFNGDGRRDLVVANNGSEEVSVFLGGGKGGFGGAGYFAVGERPPAGAPGGFHTDGRAPLVL